MMSRRVGVVLINYLRNRVREQKARLWREFVHTEVNRKMYMTNIFNHFNEYEKNIELVILSNDLSKGQEFSEHMTVVQSK